MLLCVLPDPRHDAQAPDLPEGWECHHDENGLMFYYSTVTGESRWDHPDAQTAPTEAPEDPGQASESAPVPEEDTLDSTRSLAEKFGIPLDPGGVWEIHESEGLLRSMSWCWLGWFSTVPSSLGWFEDSLRISLLSFFLLLICVARSCCRRIAVFLRPSHTDCCVGAALRGVIRSTEVVPRASSTPRCCRVH